MKKAFLSVLSVLFILLLATCAPISDRPDPEAKWEEVQKEAQDKTAQTLMLAAESYQSGDQTELSQFLEQEDPSGALGAMLDGYQMSAMYSAKALLPDWENGDAPTVSDFQNGDVLVFAGAGDTIQNIIMTLILIDPAFSHAGIADGEKLGSGQDDFILSATIDIEGLQLINGVCHQSLSKLIDHSVVIARLRYDLSPEDESALAAEIETFKNVILPSDTNYAFITPLLQPIQRDDPVNWYCSKVPWCIYYRTGNDIEAVNYYGLGDPGGIWTIQRASVLYGVYQCFLKLLIPDWLERWLAKKNPNWLQDAADDHLQYVLEVLISPDELAFSEKAVWLPGLPPPASRVWYREGYRPGP